MINQQHPITPPPELVTKKEALKTLEEMSNCMRAGFVPKRCDLDTLRTVLENLPNDN